MKDATVLTAEIGEKKPSLGTMTMCKKSMVMPDSIVTLEVDDVLYYNQNKTKFQNEKTSPYLIYLGKGFKKAVKQRSKRRIIKWIVFAAIGIISILFIAYAGRELVKALTKK